MSLRIRDDKLEWFGNMFQSTSGMSISGFVGNDEQKPVVSITQFQVLKRVNLKRGFCGSQWAGGCNTRQIVEKKYAGQTKSAFCLRETAVLESFFWKRLILWLYRNKGKLQLIC